MIVLVTGGSLGDVPIIRFLKSEGYQVITSGNLPNDIGHNYSDKYISCDYTDVGGIVQICKKENVTAIIPSSHDLAAIAASKVADLLGLPGYDKPQVSELIHNKDQLRNALDQCGISQPKYWIVNNEVELESLHPLEFPVIVKPIDLTGGNGISISETFDALRRSYTRAQEISPAGRVIIERFLSGSYHGLTCILQSGKVVWSFSDNEFFLYNRFRVSATTFPSTLTHEQLSIANAMISHFAVSHRLVDGLIHAQLIESEGEILILEICRRTPGDFYPYFVELAFPNFYIRAITSSFLGRQIDIFEQSDASSGNCVARFILPANRKGLFQGITDLSDIEFTSTFIALGDNSYIENPHKTTLAIYLFKQEVPIEETLLMEMKRLVSAKIS